VALIDTAASTFQPGRHLRNDQFRSVEEVNSTAWGGHHHPHLYQQLLGHHDHCRRRPPSRHQRNQCTLAPAPLSTTSLCLRPEQHRHHSGGNQRHRQLTQTGSGTLVFWGSNSYTGPTLITMVLASRQRGTTGSLGASPTSLTMPHWSSNRSNIAPIVAASAAPAASLRRAAAPSSSRNNSYSGTT